MVEFIDYRLLWNLVSHLSQLVIVCFIQSAVIGLRDKSAIRIFGSLNLMRMTRSSPL